MNYVENRVYAAEAERRDMILYSGASRDDGDGCNQAVRPTD